MDKKQKAPVLTLAVKVADQRSAVSTDSLASSVGANRPAISREATKPPGDSEAA